MPSAQVTPDDQWRVVGELPELLKAVRGPEARKVRFDPDLLRSASAPVARTSPAKIRQQARRDLAAGSPARGRVRPARH